MASGWKTRLYVPAGLAAGSEVAIDGAQSHRLRTVLRLAAGATVAVFNPGDGEFLCRVVDLSRGGGRLAVERLLRPPETGCGPWLAFAPLKRARLDWLIEKATELGAGALLPVWTERTQPERVNLERLRAVAVAAAEQSERLSVPEIRAPERLDRLVADWPAGRRLVVCDESGAGVPIAAALADSALPGSIALLIGPEGGFTETELDALGKLAFVTRIGLGPRVLRAETASLAALAVFQAVAGDWRRTRSG